MILWRITSNANWLIDAGSVVLDSHKLIIKKAFQQEVKKMKLDQDEKTTTVEPFNINGDASAVFSTEGPSTQEAAYKAMQESLDSDEHGTNLPKELHDGHFSKGKTLMRSATKLSVILTDFRQQQFDRRSDAVF